MTNCPICNREIETFGSWWCQDCLNDCPADLDDTTDWAANRAREFEKAKIKNLLIINESALEENRELYEEIEELKAQIQELKSSNNTTEKLKSQPTAEQEREAILKFIRLCKKVVGGRIAKRLEILAQDIEYGEHWQMMGYLKDIENEQ